MIRADLIAIASVKAPNGLKGKMWITPYGEIFNRYENLIIGRSGKPLKLLSCEKRRKGYVIALEGITDVSRVEQIKGETLYIRSEWLPETEKDEYYWCDLIGLRVVDTMGNVLGELVNIFPTGAHDVYVVNEVKQYLIPAVKDVVKEISVKEGVIVVDASFLMGLLD